MELVILVPCCFFLVALIKFLYDYLWVPLRIQHMMNSQGIKGPPYRFIHGNSKEVARLEQEALSKRVALTDDIFPKVLPHFYTWINRYVIREEFCLYWNGARPELVISEPELIKEVLQTSEKKIQEKKLSDIGREFLGNGLLFIAGEKWAKHRKLANHAFHGESLKKGQEGREIEVLQEFRLFTSEVIPRTAFGSSYLQGEKIFAMLQKLTIIMSRNLFKSRIPLISKLWKSADLLESEKLSKEIKDRVMNIVKKREDEAVNGEVNSFGNDFLGLLVNAYHDSDEKNRFSLEDLLAECKTFYFSGQETVNSLLSWIVLHLAIHEDWQEKARREVIDIFGNRNPHLEGVAKLKIMTMIISETLRLYGPSNGLARAVTREVQLGKLLLPANIDILPLYTGVHRDLHFWGDDVHHFKPERFAEGIAKATNYTAAAFLPFGLGPRSCVGMTFAMIETKIVLSMILQRYTFTLSPTYVHSPIFVLSIRPQHEIQVILEPPHHNA
ncbi:cytochrome P450 CYP749A22 isoform X2 [Gossypium hirsutum]|uniref:Cytochrome P450 CYP749A22 isoform X2 n=1 Tax=Gossypium hirsutum TaxID=3635 RepID=A0A1U8MRJ4_GOSHI|nr:cytochrome P450 CYP749A22-like isoform X2 [Gossypium hirsutum]